MSTKVTLSHNDQFDGKPDFHLYYDYADDKVHLAIYKHPEAKLVTQDESFDVVIPRDVWKLILESVQDPQFKMPEPWDNEIEH